MTCYIWMQASTHLWVTGDESLSLASFLMVEEIASQLGSDCLDKCFTKTYKAFVAHCKFVQPTNLKHLEFLSDSIVELYSLDIQKAYQTVLASLHYLSNILQRALKTKKKVALIRSNVISALIIDWYLIFLMFG